MMPITTSGVSARLAIGASAATAAPPSKTLRRLMVIANPLLIDFSSMKRLRFSVKPQETASLA
jgi:hypothetical protein